MWDLLRKIQKNLPWVIVLAMLAGVALGASQEVKFLKALILPLTIAMIFPMMVTLNYRSIFQECSVKVQATTQFMNFIVIPLIALAIGRLFFPELPAVQLAFVLIGLIPTSGMTISWTGFARGNINVAVKMTVIGLTLGAFLTPFLTHLLLGSVVDVPVVSIMMKILLLVFAPMLIGYLLQSYLIKKYSKSKFTNHIKPKFPPLSSLAVILMIFVATALKAKVLLVNVALLAKVIPAVLLFYLILYSLTTMIGRKIFSREDAIAFIFGSVMRNLSIALALSMSVFQEGSDYTAAVIAIAFIVQVKSAAWYIKLAGKFLKSPMKA